MEEAKKQDPVHRLRARLEAAHLIDDATDTRLWEEARATIAQAVTAAEATPPVDPLSFLEDVFRTMTPRLEEERAVAAATLASAGRSG